MSYEDWPWPKALWESSWRTYVRGKRFSDGSGVPNRDCEVCRGSGYYMGAFGEPSDCGCTSLGEGSDT